jgi:CBS domain-containing protein
MFVETIFPALQKRLVTIDASAMARQAAELVLDRRVDLLVVCDASGKLNGVVTKTDLVRQIGKCAGSACLAAIANIGTHDVVTCRPQDLMSDAWTLMKAHNLRNIPVIDDNSVVVGVLNARDALNLLRQEAEYDEGLLRDYVLCAGYH